MLCRRSPLRLRIPTPVLTPVFITNLTLLLPRFTAILALNMLEREITKEEQPIDEIELLDDQQRRDLENIIELQKKWPDQVTEKPREMIARLLRRGLVPMVRAKDGKITVCFYEQPLNDKKCLDSSDTIYRFGGLAGDGSLESKKTMISLISKETEKFQNGFGRAIATTRNPSVGNFLNGIGWRKVTFSECDEEFPEFLGLYLSHSSKSAEHYKKQIFYILDKMPAYQN